MTVKISALPLELSELEAVEAAYGRDIDFVEEKLSRGLSVLIECDKQLTFHLYRVLRARLKQRKAAFKLITGHQAQGATLMTRMLRELSDAVFAGSDDIIALPHLDILTTTTRSGLTSETREAAALLYEDPSGVFLAFKDPSFELPKVVAGVFAVRTSIVGIGREQLPRVICQREARKFAETELNPYALYKYVSGLNVIRLREVLSHFQDRLDFDPAHPEQREALFRDLRKLTVTGDLEMPDVDLNADIGGYHEVKEHIEREILTLLRAKEATHDEAGIREIEEIIPKGLILHGPPGTGKTFFAKAIATSLDATITIVSGPELKSRWVGESEENLRRVFSQARRSAPSIIVFDELDSFATARGTYSGSGVEHSMVNQLLTEMDGFRKEELVFVVGTTNYVEALDPALLRPGRFELQIRIGWPNDSDRREIAALYRRKFRLDMTDGVLEHLVQRTSGLVDARTGSRFSGDHLYAIFRALKREELRRGGTLVVSKADVDDAISTRKKSGARLKENEEKVVAVHEAGHAVLAYTLPHCPPIEKVSIATGEEDTLGYVMQAVKQNRYVTTRSELIDDICVLLGGRLAEELMLGDASVGAYNDLERATELARVMVCELGMSDELGLATTQRPDSKPCSEATMRRADEAIERILEEQRNRAIGKLKQYHPQLEELVRRLLEHKTLELSAVKEVFGDG